MSERVPVYQFHFDRVDKINIINQILIQRSLNIVNVFPIQEDLVSLCVHYFSVCEYRFYIREGRE